MNKWISTVSTSCGGKMVEGRCSRTSFNSWEQYHCRDCTLDPGTCSSPRFSICAMPVGFQPYKSISQSCFAHSYKPYLFSWYCGVRVCWGRSLQSITSCSLLSDSSSVDYISLLLFPQPPAVTPAAGYFSVVLILVHPASRHSSGKECFINLAQMDIGLWLLHIIWVVQRNQRVNAAKPVWCLHAAWMYRYKLWGTLWKTFFVD